MSAPRPSPAFDLTTGPFTLAAGEGGALLAEGPLTFASARQARDLGLAALARGGTGTVIIDCKGVTSSDSAGLTVLIDWLAAAKAQQRALRYTHLPAGLLALGRISEVEDMLERGV